jgi:prevent-host-death family protein
VNTHDAKSRLTELVAAAERGEEVLITVTRSTGS